MESFNIFLTDINSPYIQRQQEETIKSLTRMVNGVPKQCTCKLSNGKKCCGSNCSNRKYLIACDKKCGEACYNNPWDHDRFLCGKATYVKAIGVKGYGLFASKLIAENEFIGEYVGEVITAVADLPGNEWTYDFEYRPKEYCPCYCRSDTCKGYIGSIADVPQRKGFKEKKSKNKTTQLKIRARSTIDLESDTDTEETSKKSTNDVTPENENDERTEMVLPETILNGVTEDNEDSTNVSVTAPIIMKRKYTVDYNKLDYFKTSIDLTDRMPKQSKRPIEGPRLRNSKKRPTERCKSTKSTVTEIPSSDTEESSQSSEVEASDQSYRVKKDLYRTPAKIIVQRKPPGAVDFEFFVEQIFNVDQAIIRPVPHCCIFKSIEDARAFVLSMAIYSKHVGCRRTDNLFDPTQSIKGYTFNWMISISPFYHPKIRSYASVRQIEAKKLMRMISVPVNDEKYRLASTVMYYITTLYSAKGVGELPIRFQNGYDAVKYGNAVYENVVNIAIPFDHVEIKLMCLTIKDYPNSLDASNSSKEGCVEISETDEMLLQVRRLVSSYNKSRAESEAYDLKVKLSQQMLDNLNATRTIMEQELQELCTKQKLAKGMEKFLATIIAGGVTVTKDFIREASQRNISYEDLVQLKYTESQNDVNNFNTVVEDMVAGRETSGLQLSTSCKPTFENIVPDKQVYKDLELSSDDDNCNSATHHGNDNQTTSTENASNQAEVPASTSNIDVPLNNVAPSTSASRNKDTMCAEDEGLTDSATSIEKATNVVEIPEMKSTITIPLENNARSSELNANNVLPTTSTKNGANPIEVPASTSNIEIPLNNVGPCASSRANGDILVTENPSMIYQEPGSQESPLILSTEKSTLHLRNEMFDQIKKITDSGNILEDLLDYDADDDLL
ncbi:unnamed protein product [Orchesella dallaii]|uniref:Post-SET domain-containing protein n=1 Tax=Orchesella dallaii TaxID=48710 RepID=A0ABP1PUM2_9HEXA